MTGSTAVPTIRRMPEQPLSGLKVIETGGFIPAYAGHLLAEAGADVVRLVPARGIRFVPSRHSSRIAPCRSRKPGTTSANVSSSMRRGCSTRSPGQRTFSSKIGRFRLLGRWPGQIRRLSAFPALRLRPAGRGLHVNDLVLNALSGSASVTGEGQSRRSPGAGTRPTTRPGCTRRFAPSPAIALRP